MYAWLHLSTLSQETFRVLHLVYTSILQSYNRTILDQLLISNVILDPLRVGEEQFHMGNGFIILQGFISHFATLCTSKKYGDLESSCQAISYPQLLRLKTM